MDAADVVSRAEEPPLRRLAFVLFLVAFAVRAVPLFTPMVPREWLEPDSFSELGKIAKSLADGGGYADPYLLPSGPTAHATPLLTFLLAGLYRLFGFTTAAGWVRAALGVACHAGVAATLPWFGLRSGVGWRAGWIAGLFVALVPWLAAEESLGWSPNEPLAALALMAFAVAALRRFRGEGLGLVPSCGLGVAWGVALQALPTLLAVLVAYLFFELGWLGMRRAWRPVAALALGTVLACLPWTIRNAVELGGVYAVRSNFGLELRMGNHDGTTADIDTMDRLEGDAMPHPGCNLAEARRIAEIGEAAYMREARRAATDWIVAHPGTFARLVGKRFLHFWLGPLDGSPLAVGSVLVALLAAAGALRTLPRLAGPERAALLLPLATFPLVHYVVPYMIRYAYPVAWILVLLAASLAEPGPARDKRGSGAEAT